MQTHARQRLKNFNWSNISNKAQTKKKKNQTTLNLNLVVTNKINGVGYKKTNNVLQFYY